MSQGSQRNGAVQGGTASGGGTNGGKDAPRLTAQDVAGRIGKAARTVYDIWDKGTMWSDGVKGADGTWLRRWTYPVCVDAYLEAQAQLRQGPAPDQLDQLQATAPAPPLKTVASDRTALTVAQSILGEDAPEEALAGFAAEIDDYRRNIALLHPHARLLLVREYYRRVARSARQIEQLLDGGGGLVAAVVSVLALTGVGLVGA